MTKCKTSEPANQTNIIIHHWLFSQDCNVTQLLSVQNRSTTFRHGRLAAADYAPRLLCARGENNFFQKLLFVYILMFF